MSPFQDIDSGVGDLWLYHIQSDRLCQGPSLPRFSKVVVCRVRHTLTWFSSSLPFYQAWELDPDECPEGGTGCWPVCPSFDAWLSTLPLPPHSPHMPPRGHICVLKFAHISFLFWLSGLVGSDDRTLSSCTLFCTVLALRRMNGQPFWAHLDLGNSFFLFQTYSCLLGHT
jgi:hypothetical protein